MDHTDEGNEGTSSSSSSVFPAMLDLQSGE